MARRTVQRQPTQNGGGFFIESSCLEDGVGVVPVEAEAALAGHVVAAEGTLDDDLAVGADLGAAKARGESRVAADGGEVARVVGREVALVGLEGGGPAPGLDGVAIEEPRAVGVRALQKDAARGREVGDVALEAGSAEPLFAAGHFPQVGGAGLQADRALQLLLRQVALRDAKDLERGWRLPCLLLLRGKGQQAPERRLPALVAEPAPVPQPDA
mmetsp:Transcript_10206/g.30835  ORF Transcript_10206/g.30835 Transcript_10206/m.30835 type:complete len:214 (+) Transcript_10206:200-841(+)